MVRAPLPPSGADLSAPPELPAQRPSVAIRYVSVSPIRVRGLGSGRSYVFSATEPVQVVDPRDAPALLSTRFFVRA